METRSKDKYLDNIIPPFEKFFESPFLDEAS